MPLGHHVPAPLSISSTKRQNARVIAQRVKSANDGTPTLTIHRRNRQWYFATATASDSFLMSDNLPSG